MGHSTSSGLVRALSTARESSITARTNNTIPGVRAQTETYDGKPWNTLTYEFTEKASPSTYLFGGEERYRFVYGSKPKGYGNWVFETRDEIIEATGTYTEAKKKVAGYLKKKGVVKGARVDIMS